MTRLWDIQSGLSGLVQLPADGNERVKNTTGTKRMQVSVMAHSSTYSAFVTSRMKPTQSTSGVTPSDLSPESRMDELVLFAALSGVHADDPLRRSLLAHRNLSLADLSAVFLNRSRTPR